MPIERVDLRKGQVPRDVDWEDYLNRAIDKLNAGIAPEDLIKDASGRVAINISGDAATVGGYTPDQLIGGSFPDIKKTLIEIISGGNPVVLSGCVATKDTVTANQLNVTAGIVVQSDSEGNISRSELPSSVFNTAVPNAIYYLCVVAGATAYYFDTSYPTGKYMVLYEVYTDNAANISEVNDLRPTVTKIFSGMDVKMDIADTVISGTDQTQTAQALTSTTPAKTIVSYLLNIIKQITGKTNWHDTPDISLATANTNISTLQSNISTLQSNLNTHTAATSVHGATSTATASTIMMRDTSGRAKVAAPSASDDIARKDTVDNHAALTATHGATGAIVGTTNTQTLTNKTLTSPILTTPKIASGGSINDENNNERIKFITTASAVNEFTVVNAATGNAPQIQASGNDANIDIKLVPKGTGVLRRGTYKVWDEGNDGTGSGLDADKLRGKTPDDIFPPYTVGDIVLIQNTSSRRAYATPEKVYEVRIDRGGSLRIKFDMHAYDSSHTAYAQIYRNGAPVGTLRSTTSATFVTFTEDISGWNPGDLVQLYSYGNDSVSLDTFTICVAKPYDIKILA